MQGLAQNVSLLRPRRNESYKAALTGPKNSSQAKFIHQMGRLNTFSLLSFFFPDHGVNQTQETAHSDSIEVLQPEQFAEKIVLRLEKPKNTQRQGLNLLLNLDEFDRISTSIRQIFRLPSFPCQHSRYFMRKDPGWYAYFPMLWRLTRGRYHRVRTGNGISGLKTKVKREEDKLSVVTPHLLESLYKSKHVSSGVFGT